jgi:hypothetical protein
MNLAEKQSKGAEELVRRARLFDQNAMAMIAAVRANAMKGDKTARSGIDAIMHYIKKNPVKSPMGQEAAQVLSTLKHPNNSPEVILTSLENLPYVGTQDDVLAACVILGFGRPLNNALIAQFLGCFADDVTKQVFSFGLQNAGTAKVSPEAVSDDYLGLLCAGHCIGMGRKIQLAKMPNMPISMVSADIGWELGSHE